MGRRLLVVYHYFHPDPVVSARIFGDLAADQARRGSDVTVLTSDRSHLVPDRRYPPEELWQGVRIVRAHRPAWRQGRSAARLLNSLWLLGAWSRSLKDLGRFDAVVLGSDPAFCVVLASRLRRLQPDAAIVHWCFDVFPDAGEAEWPGVRLFGRAARRMMRAGYDACDAIVDLGPCMRARLSAHGSGTRRESLSPWALIEPAAPSAPDPEVRQLLFGGAELGVLYAGSLSRAHDWNPLLALARACRQRFGDRIAFCFSGAGHALHRLRSAVSPEDSNVRFAPFVDEEELTARLAAADLHAASVRPEFTGTVVPSKFFAALAVGRPFLFFGGADTSIARWIREHDVGIAAEPWQIEETASNLGSVLAEPARLERWGRQAFSLYHTEFSRRVGCERWARLLDALDAGKRG